MPQCVTGTFRGPFSGDITYVIVALIQRHSCARSCFNADTKIFFVNQDGGSTGVFSSCGQGKGGVGRGVETLGKNLTSRAFWGRGCAVKGQGTNNAVLE
jgi:hypothetical protein